MKKVGILTFHDASNYGAVLQAYALKKTVEKISEKVEIINYKSKFIKDSYNPYDMSGNKIKAIARVLVYSSQLRKRNAIFDSFGKRYFSLSKDKVTDKQELEKFVNLYDTIICGSDQIWNLDITKCDNSYFLPFPLKNTRKISYAASFGNFDFKNDENVEYLRDFKFGSCREEQATKILNKDLKLNFQCHVDPTLLLNMNDWNEIATQRVINEPFVLIYTVKDPNNLEKEAILYANKKGYKVVQIKNRGKNKHIDYLVNQSPQQFLALFRDAEAVFTNSFHGTVFSLIFQKQFLSELYALDGQANTRSQSLLEKLDLTDRFLEQDTNIENQVNWKIVSEAIEKEQIRSMDYLTKAIKR